jgi:hypothetical protein
VHREHTFIYILRSGLHLLRFDEVDPSRGCFA